MDAEERQHIEELLQAYKRRLRVLEKREAETGITTDPAVVNEIADLRAKIDELTTRLSTTSRKAARQQHPPECPYPGLSRYDAKDAAVFYGREEEINQALVHLTYYGGFLLIVGPSGAGK